MQRQSNCEKKSELAYIDFCCAQSSQLLLFVLSFLSHPRNIFPSRNSERRVFSPVVVFFLICGNTACHSPLFGSLAHSAVPSRTASSVSWAVPRRTIRSNSPCISSMPMCRKLSTRPPSTASASWPWFSAQRHFSALCHPSSRRQRCTVGSIWWRILSLLAS